MTAPVQDAGFLAAVVARLDKLEAALAEQNKVVSRLSGDAASLREWQDEAAKDIKELRDAVEGKD